MANVYTPVDSSYKLVFDDEFNGSSVDTAKWQIADGYNTNAAITSPANLAVANGDLVLTLASATSGAEIFTPDNGGFRVPVGGYAEARVYFSGNGTQLYDWPTWWLSGSNWPASGEHDIAEVLGGNLTVNYHSPSGAHNQGAVPGYWGDAFHVFGILRNASSADVYYDGTLVKSYATDDNGTGEQLILNIGNGQSSGSPVAYGAASQMKADYVHVYDSNPNATAVTPQAGYGGAGDTGGGSTVPPDSLVLTLSEDRAKGADAQFIAKLDGQQIAGPTSVTASHSNGATQDFTYTGAWGSGPHNLEIDFINDSNNKHGQDRNLYVNQVTFDGATYLSQTEPLLTNGALNVMVGHA